MDISDFYQTFFDEADELLADMETHLLALDIHSMPGVTRLTATGNSLPTAPTPHDGR